MSIEYQEATRSKIKVIGQHYEWRQQTIVPKPFSVTKLSPVGARLLGFQVDQSVSFSGKFYPQREFGLSRVIFNPQPVLVNEVPYYIEVKGYGADGKEISLVVHESGDVLFGMFYRNAEREYRILEEAIEAGLSVPQPLLLGKFDREAIVASGLRNYISLMEAYFDNDRQKEEEFERLQEKYHEGLESLEQYLKERLDGLPLFFLLAENPIPVLKQPDSLGIVVRGARSPIRLGDPSENYPLTERNIAIARQTGQTFIRLLDLGYLHLCPGTGNWTLAGELTDMSDCYDMRQDNNLRKVIKERERSVRINFWQDLIGLRHASKTLSPFFIEGMFGEQVSLREAAQELETRVKNRITDR